MPGRKKNILSYIENLSLLMVGILFVLFPIFFLSSSTDAFVEPKELLIIILSSLALFIFAVKSVIEGKLRLRTSPFDIPVTLLIIVMLVSSIFSTNRYDALIAFVPVLFVGFLYFVVINTGTTQKRLLFLLGTLTLGTVLASLLTIFSFFKVYPLPFAYTHTTYFTTFGSLLDQALYYAVVLPIAGYFGYGYINSVSNPQKAEGSPFTSSAHHQKRSTGIMAAFGIAFIIIAIGLGLTVFMLFTNQKPLILPFSTGLQTAFAAISQSTNVFKSLLLGSGFGTYLNDFTQYKPASYNANDALWAFTFFRSSSFALELMATTGLLGIAVFGFLIYKIIKEKNFFLPLMLAVLASIVLPFSFTLIALFFILLSFFAIVCIQNNPQRFGEAEFSLLALRKGLFSGGNTEHAHVQQTPTERRFSKIIPSIFLLVVVIIVGIPLYFVTRFMLSDFTFQQSLVAESENNGLATYQLQTAAISMFPYRDVYYRSFSQTNLALANALAINQPKGASPSAQTQKDILTLIQQSINAGRAAVTVAPNTTFNWNNLSSIYRSLIGFGQNADQFTILTLNQAIALDPNNPQQYIDLGGVYYQLGQYDNALREFQIAINLKPDYANAYYNIGHTYEQKNDYNSALQAFDNVKQLVSNDPDNLKLINSDIDALNKAANSKTAPAQTQATAQVSPIPQSEQQAIGVNKSQTTLPPHNPKEQIPAPTVSVTETQAKPTGAPSTSSAPTTTPSH